MDLRRTTKATFAATAFMASASAAFAAPPTSDYKLAFADEFNGTSLDTLKWNYNYTWGHTHNHAAYMDQSQVIVGNGTLNLQAIHVRNPNAVDFTDPSFGFQKMDYTSGAINSSGKFNATGGYFEASIKLPSAVGSWPAFWMLQGGWPPEIDIMEFPNSSTAADDTYHAYYHYSGTSAPGSFGTTRDTNVDLTTGYHTYGVEWSSASMSFYVDGTKWYTNNSASVIAQASQMYMILNHAVGGWAGTPTVSNYPADYLIDWVRVWQKPSSTTTAINWTASGATGSWDTAASWDVMSPKYQDQIARFNTNTAAAVTIAWDNSRTVGGLNFDGTSSFTLGDSNAGLQLANSSGLASINVAATSTAAHTINARVELYNQTTITNNSAQTLSIFGQIIGTGGLQFDGVGTVLVSNNNTYTGDTLIDTGTQGAAVVRVDRSRPFGTTGTIIFNTAGNSTTGRLEVLGGRDVPNNITLSGRNNTTVALENISGTNTISGTITSIAGGANYLIQSDAGVMKLTGLATQAAGVSLTSAATGTRTFTLQGVGDGEVSGAITNGTATVAINKSGAGTWTLSGANTFTGGVTVSSGKVIAGSQTGFGNGALTVAAGAIASVAPTVPGGVKIKSLALAGTLSTPTSKLDLNDRSLIIDYTGSVGSKLTDTLAQIKAGRGTANANGVFNYAGLGITSTMIGAANTTAGFNKFAIGAINNADLAVADRYTTFGALSVDVDSILIRYTYNGDANLDGKITAADYALANATFEAGGIATRGWIDGDFTMDGVVNADDFAVLDFGYLKQGSPLGFDPVAVPEPTLLMPLLALTLKRRRAR